jgi:hypothetical protein
VQFKNPDHPWRIADHAEGIAALCDKLEFKSLKERIRVHGSQNAEPQKEEAVMARAPSEGVDAHVLAETSVALWLLHSDTTNPSLEDILTYAHTEDFEKAHTKIFSGLKSTGHLQKVFDDIEKPLIPVVERMNATGVAIDVAHFKSLAKEYSKELGAIAGRIYRHAGREFNINSPK